MPIRRAGRGNQRGRYIAAICTIVLVIPSFRSNSVFGLLGVAAGSAPAVFSLVITASLATNSGVRFSGKGVGSLIFRP